jgi:Uma2 family endonuclease
MSTITRLTLDEYDRMIDAAVFNPERRIELIRGELRDMSPIGDRHRNAVNALMNQWVMVQSTPDLRQRMTVQVQSPIRLPRQQSAPQPDMSWIGRDGAARPDGDEVFLVVEVAESTLDFDRGEKAELYAAAGVPDYWIVNLVDNCVEVHRDPAGDRYQSLHTYHAGDEVQPLLFPECPLHVGLLFG